MNHLVNFRGFRYFLKSCQLLVLEVHDSIRVSCRRPNLFCATHFRSASLSGEHCLELGCAVLWSGSAGLEVQQPAAVDRLCSAPGSAPPLIGSRLQEDERHYCFLLMLL